MNTFFLSVDRREKQIREKMVAKNGRISILMLPWLAHGHVTPFFELAKALTAAAATSKNSHTHRSSSSSSIFFHISICSTSATLRSIKPDKKQLSSLLPDHIELIELNLPTDHDEAELPPHRHTTNGLPLHLMPSLKRAFDMSAPAFSTILHTLKPDLLIYDFLQPWAPALALEAGVPSVLFYGAGALFPAVIVHRALTVYDGDADRFDLLSTFPEIFCVSGSDRCCGGGGGGVEAVDRLINGLPPRSDIERALGCFEKSSDLVLFKTFEEIEGKYLDYLSNLLHKKVIPVGPLVRDYREENTKPENRKFDEWLNKKQRSSSILVSFGSEFYLSHQLIKEIAHGLELSNLNFIWVIRFPAGPADAGKENDQRNPYPNKAAASSPSAIEEQLPKGFLQRVKERGMVVADWVPQAQILNHSSIGGFMSHCGWSSVMESMKFGVPIIALPMHLDQPFNSRLVQLLGVGVVVETDGGGGLRRETVAEAVREVVVERNGERVRKKVKEFAEIMEKKGDEEIHIVVNELLQLLNNKSKEKNKYN